MQFHPDYASLDNHHEKQRKKSQLNLMILPPMVTINS